MFGICWFPAGYSIDVHCWIVLPKVNYFSSPASRKSSASRCREDQVAPGQSWFLYEYSFRAGGCEEKMGICDLFLIEDDGRIHSHVIPIFNLFLVFINSPKFQHPLSLLIFYGFLV